MQNIASATKRCTILLIYCLDCNGVAVLVQGSPALETLPWILPALRLSTQQAHAVWALCPLGCCTLRTQADSDGVRLRFCSSSYELGSHKGPALTTRLPSVTLTVVAGPASSSPWGGVVQSLELAS